MILVTGASGYTGRFLVPALLRLGEAVCCLVRPTSERQYLDRLGVEVRVGDLDQPECMKDAFSGITKVLHLAHIRYTSVLCENITNTVEHIVLVSSVRGLSKVPSISVEEVRAGEACAAASGLPYTIVRPSMIYGPGNDRNLSRLADFIRQWHFVPVFGRGTCLQQPVYVEDLVHVLLAIMMKPPTGAVYTIAGPQAICYNEVIDLVGKVLGIRPFKLHIPLSLALASLWICQRFSMHLPVEREQLLRLQEHKAYSIEAAQQDFGYAPLMLSDGLKKCIVGT